jgi:PadR family transcriptional regulator, regulatory protein PadR
MRRTANALAVAAALLEQPDARHYGYNLGKRASVRSGRLYPMLSQMLENGWLTDGWEDPATIRERRPPRRYYQLTADGRTKLAAFVEGPRK